MPAQFSVDASIKGAKRITFVWCGAGTVYTRTVDVALVSKHFSGTKGI